MIKDGSVYECVDSRKVKVPLSGLVTLVVTPGGFDIWRYEGGGEQFRFEDDDQLEETNGIITFHVPEGSVNFVLLTLSDFKKFGGPEVFTTPTFETTEDMQSYFQRRIQEA
jgi:hypothetical protein